MGGSVSHMYNLILDFDKLPIFLYEHVHLYENKLYKQPLYQILRSWLLSVVTTSSAMPVCHAEQQGFLVYGLRFARFYFRIISLPNLSNRNHSLPEPWRHSRVHDI